MEVSERCIAAIKDFEGFRPRAYEDVVGVWTVGYGMATGTKPDDITTEFQADQVLRARLQTIAAFLTRAWPPTRPMMTQGQCDALADFAFNLGVNALRNSTLWREVQLGNLVAASEEFPKWCHAGGVELEALQKRRAVELAWFIEESTATA